MKAARSSTSRSVVACPDAKDNDIGIGPQQLVRVECADGVNKLGIIHVKRHSTTVTFDDGKKYHGDAWEVHNVDSDLESDGTLLKWQKRNFDPIPVSHEQHYIRKVTDTAHLSLTAYEKRIVRTIGHCSNEAKAEAYDMSPALFSSEIDKILLDRASKQNILRLIELTAGKASYVKTCVEVGAETNVLTALAHFVGKIIAAECSPWNKAHSKASKSTARSKGMANPIRGSLILDQMKQGPLCPFQRMRDWNMPALSVMLTTAAMSDYRNTNKLSKGSFGVNILLQSVKDRSEWPRARKRAEKVVTAASIVHASTSNDLRLVGPAGHAVQRGMKLMLDAKGGASDDTLALLAREGITPSGPQLRTGLYDAHSALDPNDIRSVRMEGMVDINVHVADNVDWAHQHCVSMATIKVGEMLRDEHSVFRERFRSGFPSLKMSMARDLLATEEDDRVGQDIIDGQNINALYMAFLFLVRKRVGKREQPQCPDPGKNRAMQPPAAVVGSREGGGERVVSPTPADTTDESVTKGKEATCAPQQLEEEIGQAEEEAGRVVSPTPSAATNSNSRDGSACTTPESAGSRKVQQSETEIGTEEKGGDMLVSPDPSAAIKQAASAEWQCPKEPAVTEATHKLARKVDQALERGGRVVSPTPRGVIGLDAMGEVRRDKLSCHLNHRPDALSASKTRKIGQSFQLEPEGTQATPGRMDKGVESTGRQQKGRHLPKKRGRDPRLKRSSAIVVNRKKIRYLHEDLGGRHQLPAPTTICTGVVENLSSKSSEATTTVLEATKRTISGFSEDPQAHVSDQEFATTVYTTVLRSIGANFKGSDQQVGLQNFAPSIIPMFGPGHALKNVVSSMHAFHSWLFNDCMTAMGYTPGSPKRRKIESASNIRRGLRVTFTITESYRTACAERFLTESGSREVVELADGKRVSPLSVLNEYFSQTDAANLKTRVVLDPMKRARVIRYSDAVSAVARGFQSFMQEKENDPGREPFGSTGFHSSVHTDEFLDESSVRIPVGVVEDHAYIFHLPLKTKYGVEGLVSRCKRRGIYDIAHGRSQRVLAARLYEYCASGGDEEGKNAIGREAAAKITVDDRYKRSQCA